MRASRRQFVQGVGLAGLGLVAGCGRLPAQIGAPRAALHRIGFLAASSRQPYHDGLLWGLHDLGYVEGQNLAVEWRFTGGTLDGLREAARELVTMPVEIIVVPAETPARVIGEVSRTTPVVMARSLDPIGQGLAASLARPGGNFTGLTFMGIILAPKRLELVRDALPHISRIALLSDTSNPINTRAVTETQDAAHILGMQMQPIEFRTVAQYQDALESAMRERADALVILAGPFFDANRKEMSGLTRAAGFASISDEREWALEGGLMAYGPNLAAAYRRAAAYVDKILKGASPADLPIEQPTTFDFVINLKTAQALGLTIPEHVLLQATEVIQ